MSEPRGAEQPLHLRLRRPTQTLLALPWATPLADWSDEAVTFRKVPVGPSRHLVRFVAIGDATVALKEEPAAVARREYEALREMESMGLPSVRVIGIAERPSEDDGHPRHRLPAPLPSVPASPRPGAARRRRLSRPAARRHGLAPRRPPSRGRLLGRLLAGQHAPASRRRPAAGLPGRRRDERDPPPTLRRPARRRPRGAGRERRLRPGRPGRHAGRWRGRRWLSRWLRRRRTRRAPRWTSS